jgi:monoamine oxidase
VINRQFSALRLRDQVLASRVATTLVSWRATKPTTMRATNPTAHSNFAGEPLSHIGASQEGAILSARRAINMIEKHRHTAGVILRCHL